MKNSRGLEAKPLPALMFLAECFDASADGWLIWRERPQDHFLQKRDRVWWNNRFATKVAGSRDSDGYWCVTIRGEKYRVHRIIYALQYGIDPIGSLIDHIDGDRSNNRIQNLRLATNAENQQNATTPRTNHSGVKGLFRLKRNGLWRASLRHMGTRYSKEFKDREAAAAWLKAIRNEKHGQYANPGGWAVEGF